MAVWVKATFQKANARLIAGPAGTRLGLIERGPVRAVLLAVLPFVMPRLFRRSSTRVLGGEPLAGTLELNLRKPDGTGVDIFAVVFDGDGCNVSRGRTARPDASVTIGLADMLRLGSGSVDPGRFLAEGIGAGSIELTGDPFLMLAFPNLFGLANRKLI